jgi:hypothetical protein
MPLALSDSLDQLSAGALDWLGRNLAFFNPYSADSRASRHLKVKAALELALLCHCWARLRPGDDQLGEATELIRMLWQRPDFPQLIAAAQPDYARQYGLIYGALAPAGIDGALCRATLAELAEAGHLEPRGKSPYLRIETRYYADKAGLGHGIEPYEELIGQSVLVRPPAALPMTNADAYAITHTSFYLSDFGFRDLGLARGSRESAQRLVARMLAYCARADRWDLACELVLTQFCLGEDPCRTPSGTAGLQSLVQAQAPDGAIPGRSKAQVPAAAAPASESFLRAYHTTLVTALMAVIVSSAA